MHCEIFSLRNLSRESSFHAIHLSESMQFWREIKKIISLNILNRFTTFSSTNKNQLSQQARLVHERDIRNPDLEVDVTPSASQVAACRGDREKLAALYMRVIHRYLETKRSTIKLSATRLFQQATRVAPLPCPFFSGLKTGRPNREGLLTVMVHDIQCLTKVLFELDLMVTYPLAGGRRPPLPLCCGTPEWVWVVRLIVFFLQFSFHGS